MLAAVVKKDVGAGAMALGAREALADVVKDAVRADRLPVVAHRVPLDELEAKLGRDAEDGRAASAVGWAKVADGRAEDIFESLVAGAEFFADDAR